MQLLCKDHTRTSDTFYTCKCMWDMTSHVPNASIKIYGLYKCVSCSVQYTVCLSPGVQEWNIAIHDIDIEVHRLHSPHALNNKRRRCDEGIILLHHRLILPTEQIKNKREMRMKKARLREKIYAKKSYRIFSHFNFLLVFLCATTEATINNNINLHC